MTLKYKLHLLREAWTCDDQTTSLLSEERREDILEKQIIPGSISEERVWNAITQAQAGDRGSSLLRELNSMLKLRIWCLAPICCETFGKVTTLVCHEQKCSFRNPCMSVLWLWSQLLVTGHETVKEFTHQKSHLLVTKRIIIIYVKHLLITWQVTGT